MIDSDKKFIDGIARLLKTSAVAGIETPRPDFDERVMAAVRAEPAFQKALSITAKSVSRRNAGDWLMTPRTFRFAPLPAFAAAAALLLATGVVARLSRNPEPQPIPVVATTAQTTGADTVRLIQFVFVARDAQKVTLVGDFNNWDSAATPLTTEGTQGVWTVSIPLASGRHQYAFVVDGEKWQVDPNAPQAVEDGYGTPNSVVTVKAES